MSPWEKSCVSPRHPFLSTDNSQFKFINIPKCWIYANLRNKSEPHLTDTSRATLGSLLVLRKRKVTSCEHVQQSSFTLEETQFLCWQVGGDMSSFRTSLPVFILFMWQVRPAFRSRRKRELIKATTKSVGPSNIVPLRCARSGDVRMRKIRRCAHAQDQEMCACGWLRTVLNCPRVRSAHLCACIFLCKYRKI